MKSSLSDGYGLADAVKTVCGSLLSIGKLICIINNLQSILGRIPGSIPLLYSDIPACRRITPVASIFQTVRTRFQDIFQISNRIGTDAGTGD